MDFQFIGASGRAPAFLRVSDNCYVRASAITAVTAGVPDEQADSGMKHAEVVFVHLGPGVYASLATYPGEDEATAAAAELVHALVKSEQTVTPAPAGQD